MRGTGEFFYERLPKSTHSPAHAPCSHYCTQAVEIRHEAGKLINDFTGCVIPLKPPSPFPIITCQVVEIRDEAGKLMNDFRGCVIPLKPPSLSPIITRQVVEIRDEAGKLMNDFTGRVKAEERKVFPDGFKRTITVALDTAQYQIDMNYMAKHKSEDVYSTFNLLMRWGEGGGGKGGAEVVSGGRES